MSEHVLITCLNISEHVRIYLMSQYLPVDVMRDGEEGPTQRYLDIGPLIPCHMSRNVTNVT